MSEKQPQPSRPNEKEIERHEDQEGIPGYGQPPEEVRTTHPEGGPEYEWKSQPERPKK